MLEWFSIQIPVINFEIFKLSWNISLRVAVCKYREFAVKTETSKYFIFSQEKPFGETFSEITITVSKGFSFSRNVFETEPPKSEMLPHVI